SRSGRFVRREKSLTGTMYGSEDPAMALPLLLEHVREGRLDLATLVGPVYPLDAVDEAVAASLGGAPGRVLVAPGYPDCSPCSPPSSGGSSGARSAGRSARV